MSGLRRLLLQWFPPPLRGAWELPDSPARLRIFLLMGQSNMAGFGCARRDDPWQPGDLSSLPGVLVLGGECKLMCPRPRGRTRWRPAAHPLHLNQRSAAFGLALPFARRLREEMPDTMVGFVPCAWGGAPIDKISPGTPIYGNAIQRARLAAASGTLAGVLWHQGESDTGSDAAAAAHAGKLAAFMHQLRADLATPDLPFLIGDLGEFGDERRQPDALARQQTVRRGLRQVAAADPHAAFIESTGLPGVDLVHFGRAALIEFGQRYAEAYLNRFAGCIAHSSSPQGWQPK